MNQTLRIGGQPAPIGIALKPTDANHWVLVVIPLRIIPEFRLRNTLLGAPLPAGFRPPLEIFIGAVVVEKYGFYINCKLALFLKNMLANSAGT